MNYELQTMNYKSRSGIVSLVAVLAIGFLALGLALTAVLGALLELNKTQNAYLSDLSLGAAEAAMGEGVYQYLHVTSTSSVAPISLNGVTATSIVISTTSFPYVRVGGIASNETTRKIFKMLTLIPEDEAFKYGLFGTGDIDLSGGGQINGNVFAGGNITLGPASAGIDGDAFANGTIFVGSSLVTGLIKPNASSTNAAPQIDDSPYKALAAASGTLFTDASTAENFLKNTTNNGIVYVSSTQSMNVQKAILTGTLVTLGDLTLTGNNAQYSAATSSQPALIVRGTLSVGSGIVINGVVFVKGQTNLGSGTVVNGSVISEGTISSSGGGATINFDPLVFSAWQSMLGLSTTTTVTVPEVLFWGEE